MRAEILSLREFQFLFLVINIGSINLEIGSVGHLGSSISLAMS